MFGRHTPILIGTAALGAAATLGLLGVGRDDGTIAAPRETPVESPLARADETLPPDHPPIDRGSPMTSEMTLPPDHPPVGAASPHGAMPSASDETPALRWKMPADWQQVPSTSALRLATYLVPGGAEMSVARAGGTTEANIERWLSQFDNAGADAREERTIRGLHVTLVQVAGTYEASPMAMAAATLQAHPGWALLGAIVETSGSPYFFKLLGPAPAIRLARASFDRLLGSLTPS